MRDVFFFCKTKTNVRDRVVDVWDGRTCEEVEGKRELNEQNQRKRDNGMTGIRDERSEQRREQK